MYFDIAQLTCDLDSRRILSAIDGKPRSAKEIALASRMSMSRCYRMIREMEQYRLISRAGMDRRETSYISNLRSIELRLEEDKIKLTVSYRDGTVTDLHLGPEDLEKPVERSMPQVAQDLPTDLLGVGTSEPSTVS